MTTAELEQATNQSVQAATILERCVCLVLRCSRLGTHRKVNMNDVAELQVGTDKLTDKEKKRLSIRKSLISSKVLAPCNRAVNEAQAYLRSVSSATGHRLFGDGSYLIPLLLITEAEERLVACVVRLEERKQEVAARWGEVRWESQQALGPLYKEDEFPTAADVLSEYSIEWSYVAFHAPERLLDVDRAAYERAQASWDIKLAAAHDEILMQLREAALHVISDLAVRLKPDTNGQLKALRPTALRDLQEFLSRLPVLNVTGDGALLDAMAPVATFAQGVDVDTLRNAPAVRAMLLERAEAAVSQLDQLVSTGRRAISLGAFGS